MTASNSKLVSLNQWVSSIVNVESKSNENLQLLQSALGPVRNELSTYEVSLDNVPSPMTMSQSASNDAAVNDNGYFTHEIVFRIAEKMFIGSIKIYEKVCTDSSLMKIEALNIDADKPYWVTIWQTDRTLPPIKRPTVFVPNIEPTLFKTDTIKIVISGSLILIDAIEFHRISSLIFKFEPFKEVKGNKLAIDDDEWHQISGSTSNTVNNTSSTTTKSNDLSSYSVLARNLHTLIGNDLFADVYFECDGQVIAAHRNILISRSEYFRAMLSSDSAFDEAKTPHSSPENAIYLELVSYPQFKQVLTYLYTGHIDTSVPPTDLIGLMHVADQMNLTELEQLCLYQLSESLDESNVIAVYVEANEGPKEFDKVLQMCYDVIQANFARVSRSGAFCALSQGLMLKVIENVVPKLNRLTSEQLSPTSQPIRRDQLASNAADVEDETEYNDDEND